jgi:hypothetical protein
MVEQTSSQGSPLQDYSTRRDVLFPDYIHFTFRTRADSVPREGKDVVIMFYLLCGLLRPLQPTLQLLPAP